MHSTARISARIDQRLGWPWPPTGLEERCSEQCSLSANDVLTLESCSCQVAICRLRRACAHAARRAAPSTRTRSSTPRWPCSTRAASTRSNMRAVADRLGTGPSSLYAHFAGKDELLAAMIDRIAGELPIAEVGNGPWQEQLKDAIRAIRAGMAAHRDLALGAPRQHPHRPERAALGQRPARRPARRRPPGPRDRLRRRHPAALRERDRVRGVALPRQGHARLRRSSTSPSCGSTSRRCRSTASRTSSPWRSL